MKQEDWSPAIRRWLGRRETGIKMCGFRREEEALAGIAMGADALGFNFHPGSKRYLPFDEGRRWIGSLPGGVARVAVVVHPVPGLLSELMASGLFDAVQFHGGETAEECSAARGMFVLKALAPENQAAVEAAAAFPADGLLLDAPAPGEYGGTGRLADWEMAAACAARDPRPVVLAGGLRPDNVAAAVRRVSPASVDVASGIEDAAGHKDPARMRAFVEAVRSADRA